MNSVSLDRPTSTERPQRLWLVETLVVVGILAFGYFTVIVEPGAPANSATAAGVADPLFDLVR